jgi:formamidopyrimidine-DNA glycosylase
MPELPEVETVRIGLSKLLPGRVIKQVEFDNPKSFPNSPEDVAHFVVGAEVVLVARRAKVLLIELSSKYSLVIHLKMTGQLVFRGEQTFGAGHPNNSLIGKLPDKTTHVTISFEDGSNLFFNDQRKFGWVRVFPTAEVPNIDFFQKVGPEPLDSSFTPEIFYERLQRRKNSSIKAVLLDQTVLAGIGNIYADEGLWGAKIHPATLVKDLTKVQTDVLYKELIDVLKLSIEKGGSTDRNYVNAEGKKGSYISFAKVFRREGKSCLRCGTAIEKIRIAGRGTHICSRCQQIT